MLTFPRAGTRSAVSGQPDSFPISHSTARIAISHVKVLPEQPEPPPEYELSELVLLKAW